MRREIALVLLLLVAGCSGHQPPPPAPTGTAVDPLSFLVQYRCPDGSAPTSWTRPVTLGVEHGICGQLAHGRRAGGRGGAVGAAVLREERQRVDRGACRRGRLRLRLRLVPGAPSDQQQ